MAQHKLPLSIPGVVHEGSKRARLLGFPTINIELPYIEVSGIYAAEVQWEDTISHAAAFADPKRSILEAHLLDVEADLYGKAVEITLHQKIRDSELYTDDEDLKKAIAVDVAAVRQYFNL